MHSIATIYRFLTPFSNIEKEQKFLQEVLNKIVSYIKSENIKLKFKRKDTKQNIFIKIDLGDFWKLTFYFRKVNFNKLDDIDYILPIFKFDILFDINFVFSHKKQIVDFLTNIFECFDWVNEKEYLIELDKSICYKRFFVKKCPYYDFQDIEKLQKQFENKNWLQVLKDFLKQYKTEWFVLTKDTSKIYLKVHWFLLYLFYLIYILYKTLYGSERIIESIEEINSDLIEYKWLLNLSKERVKILGDTTEKVFKKYFLFLKEIFKLFK